MSLALAIRNLVAALEAANVPFAVVGGLAASARGEVRFTRDVDVAVLAHDDEEAEALIYALQARGYQILATVEQEATDRLATVRMLDPARHVCDVVFATSGIEHEIISLASALELFPGLVVPTASVEGLLAMKVLSATERRTKDLDDLRSLARNNPDFDEGLVLKLLDLISARGYSRNQDLREKWRGLGLGRSQ